MQAQITEEVNKFQDNFEELVKRLEMVESTMKDKASKFDTLSNQQTQISETFGTKFNSKLAGHAEQLEQLTSMIESLDTEQQQALNCQEGF